MKKETLVIHYAYQNRYTGVREDGRRVDMVPIACQGTRVSLPKGHDVTWASTTVTCRLCLEKLVGHYKEELRELEERLPQGIDVSQTKFLISKRERGQRLLTQWFKEHKPDRETLERIKHG